MILILIIVLHTLLRTTSQTCVLNNVPEEGNWERKLHNYLRCPTYNFEPPNSNNGTNVTITLILKSLSFNTKEEILSFYLWAQMYWYDERLKWDPYQFDNITTTVMMSSQIWIPGLKLINNAIQDDVETFYFTECSVTSSGKVKYTPRISDGVICNTELKNWPYDVQTCQLKFGAWQRGQTIVTFHLNKLASLKTPVKYGQWLVKRHTQDDVNINDTQILLTFVLERQVASLVAIVFYPASILTILTVTTLFLDVRNNTRLWLSIFSLVNHFLFLSVLQEVIPEHTADSPSLIMYYKGSMILSILVLLLTQVLKVLCKKIDKNFFINTITDLASYKYIKYVVLWWDCEEGNNKIWTDFASMLNSFSLYAVIVAYFSMYLGLIPASVTNKVEYLVD
ncbi:hypothetical protein K1T71_013352 [Dendrolimus kikuchii]|uniref:Uncharacterized protein n=1 Tax=Dendrolimus kikuchii TaxID=765133 RepID=A0ACC1CHU0_9NEOP|nr:hypothetical protein K1T71_013352 [Dendrolimus kikuchii]